MKKQWVLLLGFALFLLLFIQSLTVFIESIYILELLSTSLDEKVLGVLFLFSPVLLFFIGNNVPRWLIWLSFALFLVGRGVVPYLATGDQMLAAGISCAAGLILLPLMLVTYREESEQAHWVIPAQGLALAIGISVLMRTLNYTLDPTLTTTYGWIGWLLGISLGLLLINFKWEPLEVATQPLEGVTSSAIGIMGLVTIFYFMFSSPGVIARWTEGNYSLIITLVSLFSMLWLMLSLAKPDWFAGVTGGVLLAWNSIFTLSVLGTILAHTISFPAGPDSPPVVVTSPTWYLQIPLLTMLITFPVIFIDFSLLSAVIGKAHPEPRKLAPGFLLGSLIMVIMIFMNIFSNVWGYVEPVSPFFRNKFWLPFLLILAMVTIITFLASRRLDTGEIFGATSQGFTWPAVILGLVFMATLVAALMTDRSFVEPLPGNSLKVMTYNIQQAINEMGEKSYLDQLALIEQVDPDLIAFQESDSTRISLGNNDYIRYYANQLGYHSYFGPTTVTGTYGTAILSKYPLENTRAVFTFSDQDEIGTAEAEITVGGTTFSIFNVHPDGSDEAKMVFANTLVDRASQQEHVIALGDYNLRGWEQAYLLVDAHYKNAWMDAYPSGVDGQGLDMSGRERIDHIFVSPHLQVADPVYIWPPASWTDHPVHWADISWE